MRGGVGGVLLVVASCGGSAPVPDAARDAALAVASDARPDAVPFTVDAAPPDSPPPPPLQTGLYQLEITNSFFWSPGPRLTLRPDGTFTGHTSGTLWECAGALTPVQHETLTAALNDAQVLTATDFRPRLCADHPIFHIQVDVTGGVGGGVSNRFTYELCGGHLPALDRALEVADLPLRELQDAGRCTGCPVETRADECYDRDPLGDAALCVGTTRHGCAEESRGELLDCSASSFVCDGDRGFAPPATLQITSPRLTRTAHTDGTYELRLELALEVDNVGKGYLDVDLLRYLRFEDPATGEEVALVRAVTGEWVGGFTVVQVSARTRLTMAFFFVSGTDPGPATTLSALQLRVRERPWEASPFGPPIPVELHDDP